MVIPLNLAVSYDNVMEVRRAITRQIELANTAFDIDFAQLTHYDSSVLTLMLCWLRLAKQKGQTCRFTHVPNQLIDMARVYGLDKLLPMVERGING